MIAVPIASNIISNVKLLWIIERKIKVNQSPKQRLQERILFMIPINMFLLFIRKSSLAEIKG
jgi:hypothetical protein